MPKLTIGTNLCQCAACNEYFNSAYAFDKHRVGPQENRTCLTKQEMLDKKMSLNKKGFWVTDVKPEQLVDQIVSDRS